MRGKTDISSPVGVVEDLLARFKWLPDLQTVILVYPVTRDLDGRDVRSLCPRLDFTDDQVVCERRYPDSVSAGEFWWSNFCMVWYRRGKTGPGKCGQPSKGYRIRFLRTSGRSTSSFAGS